MNLNTELTERQKMILGLVVREYIDSAQPIGSNLLVDKCKLDMSSATVRNEMAFLSEAGFLHQPHTSAGRIPTEDAYRFFVVEMIQQTDPPRKIRQQISDQFHQAPPDSTEWMRLAASILAYQSKAVSIVTAPIAEKVRFKHIQLISTTGRQVLMVLVLVGGKVSQQMLVLSENVNQENLTQTANQLNDLLVNLSIEEIESLNPNFNTLSNDMFKLVLEEIIRSKGIISDDIYQDGLQNILSEPEFSGIENVKQAIRVLEEKTLLEGLLTRTASGSQIGGVQVLIGGEGILEELSNYSLVLARYGVQNLATGYLGVLGPIRMPYGQTISTVNYIAGLLSNFVSESMEEIPI